MRCMAIALTVKPVKHIIRQSGLRILMNKL